MIKEIVNRWEKNKGKLRAHITKEGKSYKEKGYEGLLKDIINIVLNDDKAEFHERDYDAEKMTVIDDGDYQGTLIFIFPYDTYQPMASEYLYTSVGYGSCSGCDTWEAAETGDNFVGDMMTLALHMIQSMKRMED